MGYSTWDYDWFFEKTSDLFVKGKYQSLSIITVLRQDPEYIHWLAENIHSFIISTQLINEIKSSYPDMALSEKLVEVLKDREENWECMMGEEQEKEESKRQDAYEESMKHWFMSGNDSGGEWFD